MARDETARESGSEQSLLERRSHLRLAGAAAATAAGARPPTGPSERDRRRRGADAELGNESSREDGDGDE
ncbi:hypothetical protein [Halorussus halobius]|uniref:hypothetical protein n=1 Tax=Halorussus halobius TaxID=1710537 RepID=UPI00109224B8|nr:hypothetical protein [Halorussus halobius]